MIEASSAMGAPLSSAGIPSLQRRAWSARFAHFRSCAAGTTTHSFIGRPPSSASAYSRVAGSGSLKTMLSCQSPHAAFAQARYEEIAVELAAASTGY